MFDGNLALQELLDELAIPYQDNSNNHRLVKYFSR